MENWQTTRVIEMRNKSCLILLLIAFAAFLAAGCAQITTAPAGNAVKQDEPFKIGFVTALSGPGVSWGECELNSARLAVDEVNAKGGVLGRPLELVVEDGKCSGKDASIAVNKLVNVDGIKVVLGGSCSSETLAMAPITENNKVLLITGMSSNPQISDAGEYIFRLIPTDEDLFRPQARWTYDELGYRKVAVLVENTDYCLTARKAFVEEFESLGGTVSSIQTAGPDERDYRSYLTKIKASAPEAVVIIPQTPLTGGLMAKQLKELWPEAKIVGGYTMESDDAIKASEGALNGAVVFTLSSEIPTGKETIAAYKAKYGKEPLDNFIPLESRDRVFIVAQAIEFCKGLDAECMKDYIYRTKFNLSIGKYGFNSKGDIDLIYTATYNIENSTRHLTGTMTVTKS